MEGPEHGDRPRREATRTRVRLETTRAAEPAAECGRRNAAVVISPASTRAGPAVFICGGLLVSLWATTAGETAAPAPPAATPQTVPPSMAQVHVLAVRAPQREAIPAAPQLTRARLDQSLQLGTDFLLRSQLPPGHFRYRVALSGLAAPEQNPVRQAGALWGLALIHHDQPTAALRQALLRGAAFYERHSALTAAGGRFIRYPGAADGDSGVVALVALALIDFLRVEPRQQHPQLRKQLSQYVAFLRSLRRADHHFYRKYLPSSGEGWGQPSPYFDGEILLALFKAARYASAEHLEAECLESAETMYQAYVQPSVTLQRDDDDTKGFFQWGCMAFHEAWETRGATSAKYAPRTISLAHWMIDVHEVLRRTRNTAYALEGIIVAYHLARETGDQAAADKFLPVIQQVLSRLTSWQVGGPMPCPFLGSQSEIAASCRGGILDAENQPWLRIDTTQHQMHAVILARRYVWRGADEPVLQRP